MTRTVSLLCAVVLVCGTAWPALAAPVVADVQVIATSERTWVVRIRASEAQPFDVLSDRPGFVVRLHGATLSLSRAPLGPTSFGRIALAETDAGVELTIALTDGSYQATAVQGAGADIVEVRITAP